MNRKIIFFIGLILLLTTITTVQDKANTQHFQIEWISNQHVLGVNKEDGHATYIPYATRAALMADSRYKQP